MVGIVAEVVLGTAVVIFVVMLVVVMIAVVVSMRFTLECFNLLLLEFISMKIIAINFSRYSNIS